MLTQNFDVRQVINRIGLCKRKRDLFQYNQLILSLLLFILPILLIVWIPGVWACFFALIILSLTLPGSINNYFTIAKVHYLTKPNNKILIIYVAYFCFSIISVFMLNSALKVIDNAVIFLLWLLISPALAIFPLDSKVLGYGCLAAVIIALSVAISQFYFLGISRPYGLYGISYWGNGAIKFGDMSLFLGILSLIFLSESPFKRYGVLASFIGFIVCLFAGARGGIFALLLCLILWFGFFRVNKLSLHFALLTIVLGIISFFVINLIMNDALLTRINATSEEILSLFNHQLDTSIGIRLQLWKAALIMFENNPFIGVGLNNFGNELSTLNKMQLVSEMTTNYKHAHNEYLCALATGGIIGFTLTCLLFLVPIAIFKKDYQNNIWAKAGFWCVCLLSFFALTDCIFDRRMTVITFALFISVCMAGNSAEKNYKLL